MARGRKLAESHSERYLGSYSYGDGHSASVTDQSELSEDDIWSATAEHTSPPRTPDPRAEDSDIDCAWSPRVAATRGRVSTAFGLSSPRIVHQSRRNDRVVGGGGGGGREMAASAPVNVPEWKKMNRVNSDEWIGGSEEEGMVPPHEYVARRSCEIGGGGASVTEGVGRTLKGRELRRVRDAVWSQTGFYG